LCAVTCLSLPGQPLPGGEDLIVVYPKCQGSTDLSCAIPNLLGGRDGVELVAGIPPPPAGHVAHFKDTSGFTNNFLPIGSAVATQLALLPIVSPASGFTYTLDQATGAYTRTAQTFGPVLTERGETLGRKKFFLGFNYQRFKFDQIDGMDMNNLPAVLVHGDVGRARDDVMTLDTDVRLRFDQFTFHTTVGLTNRFDVSVAVPMVNVKLDASSLATIIRYPFVNPATGQVEVDCAPGSNLPCHAFNVNNRNETTKLFQSGGSKSGIGDVTLRLKHNVLRNEKAAIAVLTDIRFKTGDELNFLGSGATGIKPFVAISLKHGPLSPHINIGYGWNGDSIMADRVQLSGVNTTTVESHSLPDQFFYAIGTDFAVNEWLTVATDLLGQRVFDGERIVQSTFVQPRQSSVRLPALSRDIGNIGMHNFAFGFKVNPTSELLFTGNLVFRLDSGGMRDNVVPLIGVSYSF
jgi:hypothetical protein